MGRRVTGAAGLALLIIAAVWFGWSRFGPAAPRPDDLHELDPLVAELITKATDAVDRNRRDTELRRRLGMVYEANDLTHLAIETYRQVIKLNGDDARARYRLGLAYTRRGETEAAIEAFSRAAALEPTYAAAHWRLGYRLLDAGRADEAISAFDRAIALQPGELAPRFGLALAHLQQDRADAALQIIEGRLLASRERSYAQHLRAMALRRAGRLEEASTAAREARAEPPEWTDPWSQEANEYRTGYANLRKYAEWLVSNGRFDEAIIQLERLQREQGEDAALLNMLGVARVATGKTEHGLRTLRRGIALDPGYVPIRLNLARAYLRTAGQSRRTLENALEAVRDSLAIEPNSGEAQELEATTLQSLGRIEDAIAAYHRAYELDSRHPTALLAAGVLELHAERWADAEATFRRAIDSSPGLGEATIGRAYALLKLKQPAEVLKLLEGSTVLQAPIDPALKPYKQELLAWFNEEAPSSDAGQP